MTLRDMTLRDMTIGESMNDSERTSAGPPQPEPGIRLTDEQLRAQRSRSIAIAVALGLLVLLFYIVTLVKGPGVLERPL
jgi:hypothetical protein